MSFDDLSGNLASVVAITVTPFDAGGEVDEKSCAAVLDRVVGGGVSVVTPNGNTSEFYTLSAAETELAVRIAVDAVGDRAAVVAGVGHDVATAVAGARFADRAGARGIMIHQPVHPYVSLDGWVDYHRAVASAVPELSVVLYVRNPRIGGAQIAALADACPNVVGVKYAVPDPVRFASVARDAGLDRLTWVAGLAELSAPGYFAVGATGFTSGLANVAPELSVQLLRCLQAGEFGAAMEFWEFVRGFEELRASHESANNVSVVKEALAQLGLCRRDVRPPASVLPEADRSAVGVLLNSWSLL
ncbi:dihydrodipicolinate synthase family protein [Lentzea sp. NBRC 102530]|uniref:dihydrodipicolinate synthase family protein n=1 Tax=Lentzea sp. NBRC 102530 TaxID=3032201 RepID=UPI0024A305FF|nr:dihydrodipicolinate synthase family protein [Lentzea sp. NBRC 102530]GLY53256.1 dihydrodipicolinate synthase family protein [Lentzea sp. NBRC 102530]